jgi:hypothetical protein
MDKMAFVMEKLALWSAKRGGQTELIEWAKNLTTENAKNALGAKAVHSVQNPESNSGGGTTDDRCILDVGLVS